MTRAFSTFPISVSRLLGALAVGFTLFILAFESAMADHDNNRWEFYRWPWARDASWQMTQGWNGATSHKLANGLYYAIDVAGGSQPVYAASDGYATCTSNDPSFGNYVRITHGTTSSLYGHLVSCTGFTAQNLPQGYQIGTAGCTGSCTGTHLHFQKNTSTTNTTSSSFVMNQHSNWNNSGQDCPISGCPWYQSDNRSAGYSQANPIAYDQLIRDKYWLAGHWDVVGSSAKISLWTPGKSPASTCGTGTFSGWYDCNFIDINNVSRSGRIQTFKGVGTGSGEHAILERTSYSAVFMSRALLGPYTRIWSGTDDGIKFVGYPVGDSYPTGGTMYRMDFQNGYATYDSSTCASRWFYWSSFLGRYVEVSLPDDCD